MPTNDAINKQIVEFKKTISEIDDHSEDSEFFDKLSLMADRISRHIDQTHRVYYVAFVDYGTGKTYYPIGFKTSNEARKILSEELLLDATFEGADIFEVSQETFWKYYALEHAERTYDLIINPSLTYLDGILDGIFSNECVEKLKEKIDQLRKELGFKYRWERVELMH